MDDEKTDEKMDEQDRQPGHTTQKSGTNNSRPNNGNGSGNTALELIIRQRQVGITAT